ncbi:hypothetical protein [Microcella sp.]|uniref:hypothetical protein n=1 Tax=Microcella sp. TaxID=1913979 RepID=UPI00391BD3E2
MLQTSNSAIDCSVTQAQSFEDAAPIASHCKQDVEVLAERTPWHTTWATGDGLTRLDVTAVPSRVQVNGEWVELDPTIQAPSNSDSAPSASGAGTKSPAASMTASSLSNEEGMLEVAAPVFPIELNPGGLQGRGAPLGTIEKDGHDFAIWFPIALPEPSIEGSQLVYDLGEGVRLFVTVNIDATGFIPVIELAEPSSADHLADLLGTSVLPGASSEGLVIEFATAVSAGLTYRETDNSVEIIDANDEIQFQAAAPAMWDSAAGATVETDNGDIVDVDRTSWPAEGDQVVPIDLSLDGQSLLVEADADMLASSSTVWPVYIDPTISGKGAADWVAVRSGGYTNTLHKWGDMSSGPGQGTGYCSTTSSCNVQFYQRLAWEFTGLSILQSLASSDIQSASFRVNGVHSAYCTAQATTLRRTGDVGSGNTFGGLAWHESGQTRTEYHRSTCSPTNTGFRNFDAKVLAQWGATNNQTALRMGLRVNEGSITYWKRFRHDATFTMVYNRAPVAPTNLQITAPKVIACQPNTSTGAAPAVASTRPTLSALMSDPDGQNVTAAFEIVTATGTPGSWTLGTTNLWTSANTSTVPSGQNATAAIPTTQPLVDGNTYAWRVRGTDADGTWPRAGLWSGWCVFAVNTSAPPSPDVTPVTDSVEAIYLEGVERGGVGMDGAFLFNKGAANDVVSFRYGFNDASNPLTIAMTPDGTATVPFTAPSSGDVTLTVVSVDTAGNPSLVTSYFFRVATPIEDVVWILDEGEGNTATDSFGTPGHPLTITGATWGEGPHTLFQSRQGDSSLVFDGTGDAAVSERPVIDTTDSFVVSAHVLLDPNFTGTAPATIISQDGVEVSGFQLQYVPTCAGMPEGCWAFTMPDTADGTASTTVTSAIPASEGEWVHLVGAYAAADASNPASMTLWTCDIGTPEQPEPAVPNESTVARTATPWNAGGVLAVGRGQSAGGATAWWQGQIDNVRLFTGDIVNESKIRRLCQGAEATDLSAGESALDPTTQGE